MPRRREGGKRRRRGAWETRSWPIGHKRTFDNGWRVAVERKTVGPWSQLRGRDRGSPTAWTQVKPADATTRDTRSHFGDWEQNWDTRGLHTQKHGTWNGSGKMDLSARTHAGEWNGCLLSWVPGAAKGSLSVRCALIGGRMARHQGCCVPMAWLRGGWTSASQPCRPLSRLSLGAGRAE